MSGHVVSTYAVRIYVAGDMAEARRFLNRRAYREGMCVTIEPTTFIYTGGEESGIVVGLVNYPRFPTSPDAIYAQAKALAIELVAELNQKSALLIATDQSEWLSIKPPGARGEQQT